METVPVAVFISGRGSNLQALISHTMANRNCGWAVTLVISDKSDAFGLQIAENAGIEARFIDPVGRKKSVYESEINNILDECNIKLIALAGYMRLVGKTILSRWKGRILNIHPSILPSFPGLDAQAAALDSGVKISGCTVHLVDEGMDTGEILGQLTVSVENDDTPETLSKRILKKEHALYGMMISEFVKIHFPGQNSLDFLMQRHDILMTGNKESIENMLKTAGESGKPFALISSCLCGINCRYDGKSQKLLEIERLSERYELIPVCPEAFAGMGIPRRPVEFKCFVEDNIEKCDLMDENSLSFLEILTEASEKILNLLEGAGIIFSILKERSPSCGVNWVYLDGKLVPGRGIFCRKLIENGVFTISDESVSENTNSTFSPKILKSGNKKC
ncbi:phosphoribosylglycinamide formyltransferase [Myxococcota bacterium]|nr:phosphoribosylglycinamide formyltransferase [Myxococcota bacterium]MBU1379993.1 phosphoribosylglycinamide formyltransferase [Myxococcota bacterium]MBU1496750.1 phosphoribosylglycinamide formyltransferase [Myxococcota bacterium]